MSLVIRRVISPPYCGWPRLSHQFPVVAVVVVVGLVVVAVVVVVVVAGVTVVFVPWVVVLAHDAITSDITMRHVNNNQIAPFFIQTSLYFSIAYFCRIILI